ncbi:hypothetical protein KCP70_13845 [Salmonella enterica subsp. enterica]|nr:hypothetical protein KCP70_13845 [Salmonella enterica subsp. enterica]
MPANRSSMPSTATVQSSFAWRGGSANKTYLYHQETKARAARGQLASSLRKCALGTAACPPYHIAPLAVRRLGGKHAVKTVKLASTRTITTKRAADGR